MVTILNVKTGFYEEQWSEGYINDDGLAYNVHNSIRYYFKDHFDKMEAIKVFREKFAHEIKMPCGDRYELIVN